MAKSKNHKSKPCYSSGAKEAAKIATIKFWYKGSLITKAEHDARTWFEIHESNNNQGR